MPYLGYYEPNSKKLPDTFYQNKMVLFRPKKPYRATVPLTETQTVNVKIFDNAKL